MTGHLEGNLKINNSKASINNVNCNVGGEKTWSTSNCFKWTPGSVESSWIKALMAHTNE